MYSSGPLHTDEQALGDELKSISNSPVLTQDVARMTSWKRLMIGTIGGRESRKSVQAACHDDDDDDDDDDIYEMVLNVMGINLYLQRFVMK